jgi:hypothetical protein
MSRRSPLTIEQILQWADAHYLRTGRWPRPGDGAIHLAAGETWANVSEALTYGLRGLPGGSSLTLLLHEHFGANPKSGKPLLKIEQILAWAEAHFRRTGEWPTKDSGPVVDAPGETWSALNSALTDGNRGLPGGSSLVKLRRCYAGSGKRDTETHTIRLGSAGITEKMSNASRNLPPPPTVKGQAGEADAQQGQAGGFRN